MKVALVKSQVLDGNNVFPPLGLMYVAAVLEKTGHTVQLYDADPKYYNTIVEEIKIFKPDLIGLSFLTVEYQRAFNLIQKLKKELPDVTYCAGGVHTTVKPIDIMNEFDPDFVVIGEGEDTMVEVCERLERQQGLAGVKGIMYRDNGKIRHNTKFRGLFL